MLLLLKPLFTGERDSLPFDGQLDLSSLEYPEGRRPFPEPVRVRGEVTASADVVTLRGVAETTLHAACDRCLKELRRPLSLPLEHVLAASLEREDDGDLVLVSDYRLRLDELVREDLLLSLPIKTLCRDDCRGLCPTCGKDLNDGLCGCRAGTVDPRLEALRQWFQPE